MEQFNLQIPSKITSEQMQMAILNKVVFAYYVFQQTNELNNGKSFPPKDYLLLDVKLESYRMLIVNYLTALLGRRKNDKISIYNLQKKNNNAEIDMFYEINQNEIKNLEDTRDKVYSHIDLDFHEKLKGISTDFIDNSLILLKQLLDYKGENI